MKLRYITLILLVVALLSCRREDLPFEQTHTPFLNSNTEWVDSMLLAMDVDEKIGQLILYQPTLQDSLQKDSLLALAQNKKLGGVILRDLALQEYLYMIDTLQGSTRIPLFNVCQDRVSLHNLFSDFTDLPSAMTIVANNSDTLLETVQDYYLEQLSHLGFNLSFSPGLNMNGPSKTNFDFNMFESDKWQLASNSSENLKKLQEQKILSVVGDFNDYHQIDIDTTGIVDSIVQPYTNIVQSGVSGIFVDPELFEIDSIHLLPPHFLKRYLRRHTEFGGLLISEWDNRPFQDLAYSGTDMFIIKDSFENRFQTIRQLVNDGNFTPSDLNDKVRKILMAKAWIGLDSIRPIVDSRLAEELMTNSFDDFEIRKMYENAITLAQNPSNTLPFIKTYRRSFQLIQIGQEELSEFQKYFSKFASFSSKKINPDALGYIKPLEFKKHAKSKLIVTLDQLDLSLEKDSAFITSVNNLGAVTEVVVLNFGNPYNLAPFDSTITLVQNFERNPITESLTAQFLFGALKAKGRLPMVLNDRLDIGHGIDTTNIIRLKYTVPEEVGIAAYKLVGIDALVKSAIRDKSIPGCQVLVAKGGKVIYSKSFGRHDFEKGKLVQLSDLYDLASITKVASTTLATMKLYDEEKVKLNSPLKQYLKLDDDSKLKNITVKQLLTHHSGLQSNMPISSFIMYEDTTGTGCSGPFCNTRKGAYQLPIANAFYMDRKWQDSLWQDVYDLTPKRRKRYRYSDVNFNLMMKVAESKTPYKLDNYVERYFYKPMNLNRLRYNPLEKYKLSEIVPTTNEEERFRKQLIHGYVHDESAALLGGIAGNAGLFGNAESLLPLFQMLLNEGSYGGEEYLSAETIELFTKQQSRTKRGLGFDVKTKSGTNGCSSKASSTTFGHTGFTGTCVWADPEEDIVFIFLSNRIHPDIKNRKLFKKKTRSRIHSLIYKALDSYPEAPVKIELPEFMEANASVEE